MEKFDKILIMIIFPLLATIVVCVLFELISVSKELKLCMQFIYCTILVCYISLCYKIEEDKK